MGFQINTNTQAQFANMHSGFTQRALNTSMERVSSGLRLNSAKDGAADMSIANSLRSQHHGLLQAVKNSNDGIGVLKIADGALEEYSQLLVQARDKASAAVSDTNSVEARAALEADVKSLMDQAEQIATRTQFNGINLLDGSFTNKNFQTGAYSGQTTSVSIGDATTATLGIDDASLDLTSSAGATTAMTDIDAAIKTLDGIRSGIGSAQIGLESTVKNLENTAVNVKAAESQLRDTNYDVEMENINKLSIKQQASAFALAKSFEVQSLVLNLLR